jgi:hypothetical protein
MPAELMARCGLVEVDYHEIDAIIETDWPTE